MNIISILAKAVGNAQPEAAPLDTNQQTKLYRAASHAPVTVRLPESGKLPVEPTRKPDQPPAPPKVTFEQQCQFVASNLPKPSKSELQAMRELQEKADKVWNDICKRFTREQAMKDFAIADRQQWDAIYSSGKDISECNIVTRESFLADYQSKHYGAKKLHEHLREQAKTVCAPIIQNFLDAASAELSKVEARERDEAAALGFKYEPSPRVQVLRLLVGRLKQTQNPGTPRQLCPWMQL